LPGFDKSFPNPENLGMKMFPALNFKYTFAFPFLKACNAMMLKHNWELRTNFTSVDNVQQLDEDRIQFFRRLESVTSMEDSWERVIYDRSTKEIETRICGPNGDGSVYTIERTVLAPKSEETTDVNTYIYDVQGNGQWKVEVFRKQCM